MSQFESAPSTRNRLLFYGTAALVAVFAVHGSTPILRVSRRRPDSFRVDLPKLRRGDWVLAWSNGTMVVIQGRLYPPLTYRRRLVREDSPLWSPPSEITAALLNLHCFCAFRYNAGPILLSSTLRRPKSSRSDNSATAGEEFSTCCRSARSFSWPSSPPARSVQAPRPKSHNPFHLARVRPINGLPPSSRLRQRPPSAVPAGGGRFPSHRAPRTTPPRLRHQAPRKPARHAPAVASASRDPLC